MYHLVLNGKGYLHINLYKGETSDKNVRDGFGVQLFPNGCAYVGFWKDNSANGFGRLVLPDGTYYEGEYRNNNIQTGLVAFFNGAKYEGLFCGDKNERFASGTFTFSIGDRFQGKWEEGLITQGRLYDKNLKALEFFTDEAIVRQYGQRGVIVPKKEKWLYEGGVKDNQQAGSGIIFSTFPQYFQTRFVDDKITGYTTRMRITWGEISEGELNENKKVGVWKRMITRGYEIVGNVNETRGRVTFPFLNDDYFEGDMDINWKADDKPYKFSFKKGTYYFKLPNGDFKSIHITTETESIFKIKEVLDRGLNFENTFNRIKGLKPQVVRDIGDFTQKLLDSGKLFVENVHPVLLNFLNLNLRDVSMYSGHQGQFLGQTLPKNETQNNFAKSVNQNPKPRALTPDISMEMADNKPVWKTQTMRDSKRQNAPMPVTQNTFDKRDTLRNTAKQGLFGKNEESSLKMTKTAQRDGILDTSYFTLEDNPDGRTRPVSPQFTNSIVQPPQNPLERSIVTMNTLDNPFERLNSGTNSRMDDLKRQTLRSAIPVDFGNVMTVHNLDQMSVQQRESKIRRLDVSEDVIGQKRFSGQPYANSPTLTRKTGDFDLANKPPDRRISTNSAATAKPPKGNQLKEFKKSKNDQAKSALDEGALERFGDDDSEDISENNATFVQRKRQIGFYGLLLDETIDFFEGTIIRKQKQGFCKIIYDYGLTKEGNFVDDKMEGEGMISYSNSLMLIGTFKNDLLEGPGLIRLENEVVDAVFKSGEFRSKRVIVKNNGVVIIPETMFDNLESLKGNVTVYFKNNHRMLCEIENGDFIKNQKCKLYDPFGNLWIGKIVIPKNEQFKHFITLTSVKIKYKISLDTDGLITKLGTYA